MADAGTPTAPNLALQGEGRAIERSRLREVKYEEALKELDIRHQKEREALSKELLELAVDRKVIQDKVWADWSGSRNRSLQQEAGSSTSFAGSALIGKEEGDEENGKEEGLGGGDEPIPTWAKSFLKYIDSQQRDKEKQARLKELLPVKNEVHVEVQRLLEVLDKEELRKAYDRRIKSEDKCKLIAHHQTEAAKRAKLWRFVSKKKVEAKRREVEHEGTAELDIKLVDGKLGYPKLPDIYEEIKRLLDIEKNPIVSKALQEWNRKEELISRRVERKKNRVASLKNEVYQLFGFFSVFQGVVLTAVAQSSLLHCHNKWSPIALSVLASVISTFGVIQKLDQINSLQVNIDTEDQDFRTAVLVGQRLRGAGPKGIDFSDIDINLNRKSKLSKKRHAAHFYYVLVVLTLVAFGLLFPISFWRILCKPGAPPTNIDSNL